MDDQSIQEIEKHKKRSLKRYRKNLACIRRLEKKLVKLDERITVIKPPSLSGMPRGSTPVTHADLISDKVDLENRIERLKAKSHDLKKEVCEEIDCLEDTRYCEVLEAYFIDELSFESIADEMNYTVRHVYNLYKEAISLLVVMELST